MKNFICGFNTTEEQLQFLLFKNLNDLECTILSNFQKIHGKELFVFQNKQLTALHYRYIGKAFHQTWYFRKFLKNISTLKSLGIDMYIIGKLASDIASALSHNKELE